MNFKKVIALIYGAASLVAGVPANPGPHQPAEDHWSFVFQAPSAVSGAIDTAKRPKRILCTSTGFTGADGYTSPIVQAAFETLLPKDVPKPSMKALVINAPTALRPGVYQNPDAPVDAESFAPQLIKFGVGEVVSTDLLSKDFLPLRPAEQSQWSALVHKAYEVNTMSFRDEGAISAHGFTRDVARGVSTLGDSMIEAGSILDAEYAPQIREFVSQFDIIAVNGGEPAIAALAMRTAPEFARAVVERINDGLSVGIFRSAGSMLAGADIGLTHEIDDQVRDHLLNGNTSGVGIIPGPTGGKGAIRPHYGEHWDLPMLEYERALTGQGQHVGYWGIPNGEALACVGSSCREVGDEGLTGEKFKKFLIGLQDVVTTNRIRIGNS